MVLWFWIAWLLKIGLGGRAAVPVSVPVPVPDDTRRVPEAYRLTGSSMGFV